MSKTGTLTPGQTLGRYEIAAFLAAGGMGEVYKAFDARLNRVVAIKRLTGPRRPKDAQSTRGRTGTHVGTVDSSSTGILAALVFTLLATGKVWRAAARWPELARMMNLPHPV